ncbi:DUF5134 domain-containing protein [Streptomyces sp. NPDC093595]|uniref:DUF5134 domain-containing protein n=1 Tax=Streptomyces sp. NPDC093595 TaxID=3366045 RepID=UPI00381C9930
MHGPAMTGWLLAALCGSTAAYCLVRMRRCGGAERTAAGGEAVMGFGMAAMAVPVSVPQGWVVYAAVFGAASLHAAWPARRGGHHLHHLVGSLAMVYMAVVMAGAGSGAHGGHGLAGPGGVPLVTGALLAYYAVYVVRAGTRLVPVAVPAGGPVADGPVAAGAGVAAACRVSMGTAMLAMLLTL